MWMFRVTTVSWKFQSQTRERGFLKRHYATHRNGYLWAIKAAIQSLHFRIGFISTNSIIEQPNGQLILENSKETGGAKVTIKLLADFTIV